MELKNKIQIIVENIANDARHKWRSHEEEENCIGEYVDKIVELNLPVVVKSFYCHSEEANGLRCSGQCLGCDGMERDEKQD